MRLLLFAFLFCCFSPVKAQMVLADSIDLSQPTKEKVKPKVYYGIASYYADKFEGRQTANGEIYAHSKLTAACNIIPLGTWIRVTNLRNNKSVIVKTNDRLHIRMKRVVYLSRLAAEKLGYIGRGLTNVKVEVLEKNIGHKQ